MLPSLMQGPRLYIYAMLADGFSFSMRPSPPPPAGITPHFSLMLSWLDRLLVDLFHLYSMQNI